MQLPRIWGNCESSRSYLPAERIGYACDPSDAADVTALAEATLDRFGAVHVVCNNAGVGQALRPVWEFSTEYWQWLLSVNLYGVIHSIQTFVPIMLRHESEGTS
jgi:NAD(P)-dependent dehydrogenase (short-subunit alcohol dehydrogenase family)